MPRQEGRSRLMELLELSRGTLQLVVRLTQLEREERQAARLAQADPEKGLAPPWIASRQEGSRGQDS